MTASEALFWSGIVVTLAGWANCYARWEMLDLIDFFVLGVMLFFGVYSIVNSLLTDVSSYDPYTIIAAHLLVLVATAAVRTFGYMIPVRVRRALEFKSLLELARSVSGTSLMVLIVVSCAFSVFGLVKYGIVGAGVNDDLARSELPYWFTSLKQVEYAGTLAGLLVCTAVRVYYRRGTVRVWWTLAMLVVLVLLVVEGRRIACLSLLTLAVIYSKARQTNPFRPGRLLLAAPFGAVILLMYSNVFQTYRESFGVMALKGWFDNQASLTDAVASNDVTMANVSQREGTWTYPYLVVKVEGDNGPLKGALFTQAAKNLMPSAIQPHKEFKDPDELLEELYGLPQEDLATNIFGLTYADFGVAGIFVLVMVVCFTAAAIGFMINATGRFPIIGILVFGMGLQAMFMAEGEYENYLVLLRTLTVLLGFLFLDRLQRERARDRLF
jgi:hypothetical protein